MASIIGLIIALIAAILVGQDAKKRGMNIWGWSLFVFFLLIIGLPAYFIARKPIKNIPQKRNNYENTENKKPDEYSLIQEKKEALSDLATENIITVNEYNEKLTLLNEQEQDIIGQQKKKQIDSIVKAQIEPFVSKLDALLKARILSKEEFETKKKQLYKKYYEKIVHSIPHLNLNSSHQIEIISKYSLKGWKQNTIADLQQKLQKGDVILTDKRSKKKFYICSQEKFNSLLNSNDCKNYIYIHLHYLNSNNSHKIITISKDSLTKGQQRIVTELEPKLQKGDVILTDKKTKWKYYIYTRDNFNTLLNSNACQKYIYVDLHIEEY